MLGLQQPEKTPAKITISEKAQENIKAGIENMGNNVLKLSIDSQFNTRFSIEEQKGYEIISEVNDIKIYMDIGTVKRADGISIDWVEDLQGAGLVINNPNQPKKVNQLSSSELKKGIEEGRYQNIYDVRSEEQFNAQTIPGAKRLDKENMQHIETLNKETPIVFVCTSGATSQGACDFFHKKGFTDVNNLIGGVMGYKN
jgi:monothiol glutaredoxin